MNTRELQEQVEQFITTFDDYNVKYMGFNLDCDEDEIEEDQIIGYIDVQLYKNQVTSIPIGVSDNQPVIILGEDHNDELDKENILSYILAMVLAD